jgi:predicted RND superfamily exporter protein
MKETPALVRAIRDQRRAVILALILSAAGFWIFVPLGDWQIGVFVAAGLVMGLFNHIASELSLLKMIESGEQLTRNQIAGSAFVRLVVVSVVGVALAVVFWPDGITVLIGLALFRLMTLVMTSIPLIKELNKA